MAASRNDQAILAVDTLFVNRVRQSLVAFCVGVITENAPVGPNHVIRATQANRFLQNADGMKQNIAYCAACDVNVIADATVAGTAVLTTGNVDAQQALVTDAHLDAAVQAAFVAFISP